MTNTMNETKQAKTETRIAVVTGGSRGIGKSTVLALAESGVYPIFTFVSRSKEADEIVSDDDGCQRYVWGGAACESDICCLLCCTRHFVKPIICEILRLPFFDGLQDKTSDEFGPVAGAIIRGRSAISRQS
jgi:NAD(P)-dependent dehydrogenase (short-subunit alcohol dehydrogenase family)